MICKTKTILRGEPLSTVHIKTDTRCCKVRHTTRCRCYVTCVKTSIQTNTAANEPVVTKCIGLIRAANDIAVLVAITILLSESVHGEEEACCSKNSEDCFHTFHNRV